MRGFESKRCFFFNFPPTSFAQLEANALGSFPSGTVKLQYRRPFFLGENLTTWDGIEVKLTKKSMQMLEIE